MSSFHPYWFGVKLEYVCSLCCITSVNRGVMNAPTNDVEIIKRKIDRESLLCLHCGAPLGHGTEVDANIVGGTPEYLRGLGFEIPTEPKRRKKSDNE